MSTCSECNGVAPKIVDQHVFKRYGEPVRVEISVAEMNNATRATAA